MCMRISIKSVNLKTKLMNWPRTKQGGSKKLRGVIFTFAAPPSQLVQLTSSWERAARAFLSPPSSFSPSPFSPPPRPPPRPPPPSADDPFLYFLTPSSLFLEVACKYAMHGSSRAGLFRYFLIFSIIKNDFLCKNIIFYYCKKSKIPKVHCSGSKIPHVGHVGV